MCNILALLCIVFVPYANYDIPSGLVIYIFSFARIFVLILATVSLFLKQLAYPFYRLYCVRIQDLYDSYLIILVEFL